MAKPVAYGCANRVIEVVPVPCGASQTFNANSGKFVTIGTSRYAYIASSGSTLNLVGWADAGTFTSASTAGQDILPVNIALDAVYEMPINCTQTESQLQTRLLKTCDLVLSSGIQYCNFSTCTDNSLLIVGYKYYDANAQSFLVRLWHPNSSVSAVA